jgi:hypothetical protein
MENYRRRVLEIFKTAKGCIEIGKHGFDIFIQMRDAVDGFKAGIALRSEYLFAIAF